MKSKIKYQKISVSLIVAVMLVIMAGCGGSSAPSSSNNQTQPPSNPSNQQPAAPVDAQSEYDKIVAAAKEEKELIYWGTNPRESTMKKIEEAFEKRFGFDITISQVNISAKDMGTRVVAESQSGKGTGDVMWGSLANLILLEERGLLQTYPWVETFGEEFPDLKTMVEKIPAPLTGKGLEYYHLVDGLSYNTQHVTKEELPKTYHDLADPKWKGQIAIGLDATGFHNLVHVMPEEEVISIVNNVMKNSPMLAKGSPEVVEMVATGQVKIGIGALSSAEAKMLTGAPVGISAMNPTPVKQTAVYLHPNAPHPNLAKLFAAWFATEAKPIYAEEGRITIWPGQENPMAKMVNDAGAKVSWALDKAGLDREEELRGRLSDIIANTK